MTLIELMISILLGLLLVAAAGGIFMSNQQTYRATESLGRVQENAVVAFDLMTREIREAGGFACDSSTGPASMLNSAAWWNNLANGIRGYDNGALWASPPATASAIADALELVSATTDVYTIVPQTASNSPITTTTNHTLVRGDAALICDFQCATIFQKTDVTVFPSAVVAHIAGVAVLPGNSLADFTCSASDPTAHVYAADGVVAKLRASRWYVATNPDGVSTLYRAPVVGGVLGAGQQIVEGVSDMQLEYLERGESLYTGYTTVPGVADPRLVTAVRIVLTLNGNQRVGTTGGQISRKLTHTVAIRNRIQ